MKHSWLFVGWKLVTYCTDWGYGPVAIAKKLAQNQTIRQARMLLNLLQPRNVQAIILSQCDKRKLHLNCAANKHSNLPFSRIGASSKTWVIQTGKVSEHLKKSLILIIWHLPWQIKALRGFFKTFLCQSFTLSSGITEQDRRDTWKTPGLDVWWKQGLTSDYLWLWQDKYKYFYEGDHTSSLCKLIKCLIVLTMKIYFMYLDRIFPCPEPLVSSLSRK